MTANGTREDGGAGAKGRRFSAFAWRAVLFLTVALCGTEAMWRLLGYTPKKSDKIYFARLRKAADVNAKAVALVGSSRVRYGLDPEAMQPAAPGRRFLQLAIDGNSAMPGFWDLAHDPAFKGLVLCELNPAHWGGLYQFDKLPDALAYTHPEVSGAYLEMVLDEQVRQRFVFFSYNLITELPGILRHKPPKPAEREDRFVPLTDPGAEIDARLEHGWERVARESAIGMHGDAAWKMPEPVLRWVQRIRGRGGDVAFVRMPIDGSLRVLEEQLFRHGSSLIEDVRAHGIIAIDFAEMPGHFYCPDGSHLEAAEAERFSKVLGEQLAAKGFFK